MTLSTEKDVLINRSRMIQIARKYNILVSKSTIHRWANKPEFPLPIGQNGRSILYSRKDFITFLDSHIKLIQLEH